MADRRCIEDRNGDSVFDDVNDCRDKISRLPDDRLAGFEIDLQTKGLLQHGDRLLQLFDLIALAGDMMAAAEIDPLQLRQQHPEFVDDGFCQADKRI